MFGNQVALAEIINLWLRMDVNLIDLKLFGVTKMLVKFSRYSFRDKEDTVNFWERPTTRSVSQITDND